MMILSFRETGLGVQYTIKIKTILTPEKAAVITLKFEQGGFTVE